MRGRAGDHTLSITVDGRERDYVVHWPSDGNFEIEMPLVIMLHGGRSTARNSIKDTGWPELADRQGFFTVFPEALRPNPLKPPHPVRNAQVWNDGSMRMEFSSHEQGVDDVRFISVLIDHLIETFSVDERRVYVAGFSNGASMAFRLARELSGRIAAIAAVAGRDRLEEPDAERPLSVLCMVGTEDPFVRWDSETARLDDPEVGNNPVLGDVIRKWVPMLHCFPEGEEMDTGDSVQRALFRSCDGGTEILFYLIGEMGHCWPGGAKPMPIRIAGPYSDRVKATELIWAFFKRHSKGA